MRCGPTRAGAPPRPARSRGSASRRPAGRHELLGRVSGAVASVRAPAGRARRGCARACQSMATCSGSSSGIKLPRTTTASMPLEIADGVGVSRLQPARGPTRCGRRTARSDAVTALRTPALEAPVVHASWWCFEQLWQRPRLVTAADRRVRRRHDDLSSRMRLSSASRAACAPKMRSTLGVGLEPLALNGPRTWSGLTRYVPILTPHRTNTLQLMVRIRQGPRLNVTPIMSVPPSSRS